MYNINLKVLGARLKQIRESLELSQSDIANEVKFKQNAISNLELGKGGSLTLLINLLTYFSAYVYIDLIFSENFYIISNNPNEEATKSPINSIAVDMLNQDLVIMQDKIAGVVNEYLNTVKKVSKLLHQD